MQDRNDLIQQFLESTGRMYRCILPLKNQVLHDLKINRSQLEVLMYLLRHEEPTIKDISHAFTMTSSAATQLIEGLVTAGLVKRHEAKEDRRLVKIQLTKKGQITCQTFKTSLFSEMAKRLTTISDQELQDICLIAEKITKGEAN